MPKKTTKVSTKGGFTSGGKTAQSVKTVKMTGGVKRATKRVKTAKKAKKVAPKKRVTVNQKRITTSKKSPKKQMTRKAFQKKRVTRKVQKKRKSQNVKRKNFNRRTIKPPNHKTINSPLISYPVLPFPKIHTNCIPISPHVLNLKNLPEEKVSRERQGLSEETFSDLFKENVLLEKSKDVLASLQKIKRVTTNKSFSLPKISIPRVEVPKLPKLSLPQINKGSLPYYWKRTVIGFALFTFLLVLPVRGFGYYKELSVKKGVILATATEALGHLQASQEAFAVKDLYATQQRLKEAGVLFTEAQEELNSINIVLQKLIRLYPPLAQEYITAQNLLEIGKVLSNSGSELAKLVSKVSVSDDFVTTKLQRLAVGLETIAPQVEHASNLSKDLTPGALPEEYQKNVEQLQAALPLIHESLDTTLSLSDFLLDVLGQDRARRYLFVFQNNNEIRPTGGFIGSIALVDVDRGIIKKIDVPGGGSYDLQGSLVENIKPPHALRPIAERWEFQDANFFPDFPTSAKKLIWFFEQSGGPSVDGVIALNATLLKNLLGILGPVEMKEYGLTITKENFFDTVQTQVEFEYDKEGNKPKQIIADLVPEILNRLFTAKQDQIISTLSIMQRALENREIQIYLYNDAEQQVVEDKGWGGSLVKTQGDYINIVSTNIAGGKTDATTSQYTEMEVTIQDDGSIINRLRITKSHEGDPEGVFTSIPNVDYMRIYVPLGSKLLSASGFNPPANNLFELDESAQVYAEDPDLRKIRLSKTIDVATGTEVFEESGKSVFANWLITGAGETRTVELTYQLPFMVTTATEITPLEFVTGSANQETRGGNAYSLVIQKQSGKRNTTMTTSIILPDNSTVIWKHPDYLMEGVNTLSFTQKVVKDIVVGIIFQ